jgi:hypothetical protein
MNRKIFLACVFTLLTASLNVQATPVLNENSAVGSNVTIYPDDIDPNLFYFTPQYLGICSDEHGDPIFNYTHVPGPDLFSRERGLMLTTLCIKQHAAEMQGAFEKIIANHPRANFVGLPIARSSINFADQVFEHMVIANSCNNVTGVMGQEESCSVLFSSQGKGVFEKMLRSGIAIVLQFKYTVEGVVNLPGGYQPREYTFGTAARISKSDFGDQLEKYLPQKHRD